MIPQLSLSLCKRSSRKTAGHQSRRIRTAALFVGVFHFSSIVRRLIHCYEGVIFSDVQDNKLTPEVHQGNNTPRQQDDAKQKKKKL